MDGVGPRNNWQSLDSCLDNMRLRLCRLEMIECGETMPISFANHQRVVLKEQSRGGGELIVVDRLIQPHGAHFNVRCISPKRSWNGKLLLEDDGMFRKYIVI
ncbi:ULP_PROTEASE domain-containing protein [Raphanus sativus]|nr:ULP_PROTEASE domain-containing protein [Raphanus sativus]